MTTKSGNLGLGSLEKWDIATTKKFLKLYRTYRCLWDHTDSSYKDKSERQNALENIAESMNIPGFDSRYVVLKVRALRSTYLYERRKVRLRLKNGEKFQTHLGWFHLADSFLRNYVVEKSYLHGNIFKDPNKDLPPPVDDNNFNQTDNTSANNINPTTSSSGDGNVGFPKEESTVYDFYEDQDAPKSQITQYADEDEDNDQEFHLHVLEVHQKPMQQQQIQSPPAAHNIQEVQIKNPVPIKQTRAQARKIEQQQSKKLVAEQQQVPLKQRNKIEQDLLPSVNISRAANVISDEKMYIGEEQIQQQQLQQQPQSVMTSKEQVSYMIPISQPGTPAPSFQPPLSASTALQVNSNMDQGHGNSTLLSQNEMINQSALSTPTANTIGGNNINNHNDEDEFDAFAKSVAMQLRKIPKADAYSLQVQFQLLLSQAKLKAMGKGGTISFDLSSFMGKG